MAKTWILGLVILTTFSSCGSGLVPPRSTSRDEKAKSQSTLKEQSCANSVCGPGLDCININGVTQCADPCQHYTILENQWRSTALKTSGTVHCDVNSNWQGWYMLYLGNSSVQLPERCIQPNTCGTNVPLWLSKPHPSLSDGIVLGTVCGSWAGGCCTYNFSIRVKACPNNRYVYKLVSPPLCFMAYCADANSAVCSTCSPGTSCVSADKITWTCQNNSPAASPQLVCNKTEMLLGIPVSYATSKTLNSLSGHLADPSCTKKYEDSGTVWYEVQSQAGVCGNMLKTNSTDAIYSNILYLYPANVKTFALPTAFPFSCVYPLESRTSLELALEPFMPLQEVGLIGVGPGPQASISLYHDSNFTSLYSPGPVTLPIGTPLYVSVNMEDVNSSDFVVVLEECYITDTANADGAGMYYLIQNGCADDLRDATVIENGVSQQARFIALLFLYEGNYNEMFLQCTVSLCDSTTNSCASTCASRTARSVSNHINPKTLTIGPITWTKKDQ